MIKARIYKLVRTPCRQTIKILKPTLSQFNINN